MKTSLDECVTTSGEAAAIGQILTAALGSDIVCLDPAKLDFFANDVFWQSEVRPQAIVIPKQASDIEAAVRIAAEHGAIILPRGGGLSYAKGYVPPSAASITLDLRQMSRVVDIDTERRFVTVEAGCTWAQLNEALLPTGFRTPYWGPMSGLHVTVGGALSHISAFYGSSEHGTVAESVLGMSVVLPDGSLVTTGAGGRRMAKPFTRYAGGPDLTGLFVGDNGAFGVKVSATLRLIPQARHVGYLSFGFSSMRDLVQVQTALVDTRKIAESFGVDKSKAEQIVNAPASARAGAEAVDLRFLLDYACTLHLTVEDDTEDHLADTMQAVRAIAATRGHEISDALPRGIRKRPFGPVRGVLSTTGERWVPCHAMFPLGDAVRVADAMDAHLSGLSERMRRYGIRYSHFTMCIRSEFFYETAFYWRDNVTPLHVATVGHDAIASAWCDQPAQPEVRAVVEEIRRAMQGAYAELGGASWQAARDYPFEEVMKPSTRGLLLRLKCCLDPDSIMNPGVIGHDC